MRKTETKSTGDYLTVANLRDYLNISQAAAYQLVHRRDFPSCQFGGSIRIPKEALRAWLDKHTYIPADLVSTLAEYSTVLPAD